MLFKEICYYNYTTKQFDTIISKWYNCNVFIFHYCVLGLISQLSMLNWPMVEQQTILGNKRYTAKMYYW